MWVRHTNDLVSTIALHSHFVSNFSTSYSCLDISDIIIRAVFRYLRVTAFILSSWLELLVVPKPFFQAPAEVNFGRLGLQ